MAFFSVVMLGEGFRDFYSKSQRLTVESYVAIGGEITNVDGSRTIVTAGNADYDYDSTTETFTDVGAGNGSYGLNLHDLWIQRNGDKIESYVDTANIFFYPDKVKDHSIEVFVKTAKSLAGCNVAYASDGNYTFRPSAGKKLGTFDTTGAFPADTVRYKGTAAFTIRHLEIQQRDAHSVKFRVEAKNDACDVFKLYSIEINAAGLWFEGGQDDA